MMAPWLLAATRVCEFGFQVIELMNCRLWRPDEALPDEAAAAFSGEKRRRATGLDIER